MELALIVVTSLFFGAMAALPWFMRQNAQINGR